MGWETMAKHPPRPRYRFCWECSRQLQGNAHRVVVVHGIERIVHAACAAEAVKP